LNAFLTEAFPIKRSLLHTPRAVVSVNAAALGLILADVATWPPFHVGSELLSEKEVLSNQRGSLSDQAATETEAVSKKFATD